MKKDNQRVVSDVERNLWFRIMNLPLLFNPVVIKKTRIENEQNIFHRSIDLHGCTVQDAWYKVNSYIDEAKRLSIKEVLIITGKSGDICREFPMWMSYRIDIKECKPQNGGGAYKLRIKELGCP
jgi:hypothetical protein